VLEHFVSAANVRDLLFKVTESNMKRLLTLAAALGALAGAQTIAATPAAAGGYCGYYGSYGYASYYGGCCPRYYEVVGYRQPVAYQPVVRRVVRTVSYYQVVGYRPVMAYSHYRSWRR
jgi:hypothetical protein